MGSARALACGVPRPRGTPEDVRQANHLVTRARWPLTGEGAGQHTRGRVCSPKSTEWLRLKAELRTSAGSWSQCAVRKPWRLSMNRCLDSHVRANPPPGTREPGGPRSGKDECRAIRKLDAAVVTPRPFAPRKCSWPHAKSAKIAKAWRNQTSRSFTQDARLSQSAWFDHPPLALRTLRTWSDVQPPSLA